MEKKKSLLERYEMPIHHLDFTYINTCKNAREVEKIVQILRSGEEGYFPDLTKCAEDKLKELKPNSRLFRTEEPILNRDTLPKNEWKPIYDWNHDIKSTDSLLQKLPQNVNGNELPPVRTFGKICKTNENEKRNRNVEIKNNVKKSDRIASTDYNKWEKFDADEEILRIELSEERAQEDVEKQNRINMKKIKEAPKPLKISELVQEMDKHKGTIQSFTDIEKEKLSEEYRLHGNDYFRAKEFDEALIEYTKAIQIYPTKAASAYNNRALTYFKLKKYYEAIKDCEECLKLEPNNLKARLRLADANYAYGQRRESYNLYLNVLKLDPENTLALKAVQELREIFQNIPPANATRLTIQESNKKTTMPPGDFKPKNTIINKTFETQNETQSKATIDFDLADLIKPNRIVKNKIVEAAEKLSTLPVKKSQAKQIKSDFKESELLLPSEYNSASKIKTTLIEEIS